MSENTKTAKDEALDVMMTMYLRDANSVDRLQHTLNLLLVNSTTIETLRLVTTLIAIVATAVAPSRKDATQDLREDVKHTLLDIFKDVHDVIIQDDAFKEIREMVNESYRTEALH